MLIVDAQVHIWANHTPERPWPADGFGREHCAEALTADALIARMDEAGVDRAVIVPPSWEGERNDLALDAARRWPDRFAVMGRLDPRLSGLDQMLRRKGDSWMRVSSTRMTTLF